MIKQASLDGMRVFLALLTTSLQKRERLKLEISTTGNQQQEISTTKKQKEQYTDYAMQRHNCVIGKIVGKILMLEKYQRWEKIRGGGGGGGGGEVKGTVATSTLPGYTFYIAPYPTRDFL